MAFLELNDISKIFPAAQKPAVDNFNLEVKRGEFVSFLGPSGCGKTTTLRMIAGFETPSTGQILIEGQDITNKRPNQRNIGMVFQSYALFPNMTVADNIGFGLKVANKPSAEIKQRVGEMLALIKLEDLSGRYPYQLSGGQQQRVALARALAIRPQLLLLDEPLSALDAKIRVALRHEIRSIQQQLGIATVYVTHDQEEALSLSDRIVVMNNGLVEQVGSPFEIYNFPTTSFVASFVGTLNSLPAEIIDASSGRLRVNQQEVYTTQSLQAMRNGASVRLALRPEQLRAERHNDGENSLQGTVRTITFLGSVVRLNIEVGGALLALDEFNHPRLVLPQIGETVAIYFPREACLVLEQSKGK
jgi:putative spermidine/putrescine transport system ATP-binding protein